jgi:hypothetical protein
MDDESFNLVASLERKYGSSYFIGNASDDVAQIYPIKFPLDDLSLKNEEPKGAFTHLMRIMKVFEKIMIANRSSVDGTMDQTELDILTGQIELSLLNWNKSFQIWLSTDSFLILADKSSIPTVPWMSTFLEVVYHFCIICIHRPIILKHFLKYDDSGSLNPFIHPSSPIVEASASAISSILEKNDFANFFINTPSFTHTILFHLGLTYGMLLYISPHSPNCNIYIRHINACMGGLSAISRYFSPTRNKWNILRKIATTFYRKKTDEELSSQLDLFKESIFHGYPLIGPYVSSSDAEEYTNSQRILNEHRLKFKT